MKTTVTSLDTLVCRDRRGVSSAGRSRSAGNRNRQASGDRARREKQQQPAPVPAGIGPAEEGVQERQRKDLDHHRRHQATASDFPEPCLRKVFLPKDLPTNDGLTVGPKSWESSRTLRGEAPCRMAATKMTTAPRYTFRPRNRTDGGVTLLRQPSRSQQKLSL